MLPCGGKTVTALPAQLESWHDVTTPKAIEKYHNVNRAVNSAADDLIKKSVTSRHQLELKSEKSVGT